MLAQQHHMLATKPLPCGLWGGISEPNHDREVEQVWPGEPPNGMEGRAGLRQDHHETDSGSRFTWPCDWDGVRLTLPVVYHPVSKKEQSILPVSENQGRVGWLLSSQAKSNSLCSMASES